MTGARELRLAALFEAITLATLICVAVPLKRFAEFPAATAIVGPVHGIAFLFLVWITIRSWAEGLIDGWGSGRLILGAVIPFAGFVNERWLARILGADESDA